MRWLRLCLRRAASNAQIIRVFILFFNSKKKEAKNAALKRRGVLCTAQIAFVIGRHALACKVGCKMDVGCETALRAVRDRFFRWFLVMALLQWLF